MELQDKYMAIARKIDLFRGLDPADVGKIFAKGVTVRAAKGEALFYKGTVGNQMYVVLGGKVGILDGEKLLATLHTGDMFGEMAIISNEPRSASAVALEDSALFVLSESTFHHLMTKRVAIQILLNIISVLGHRLRDANTHLRQLGGGESAPTPR